MIGFLVYLACTVLFYALAIHACVSKKAVGIWAHERTRPNVKDIKAYNKAVSVLFGAYGTMLTVAGLPMLFEMSDVYILLGSGLFVMLGTLGLIVAAVMEDNVHRVRRGT